MPSDLFRGIGIGLLVFLGLQYILSLLHFGAWTWLIAIILAIYLIFLSKK